MHDPVYFHNVGMSISVGVYNLIGIMVLVRTVDKVRYVGRF